VLKLSPVDARERVEILDVLRGFALFGILLVNMAFFAAPLYLEYAVDPWWTGRVDHVARMLIRFLAQGKFYALFSFLFGVGLAIQLQRAQARGVRFDPFFARRMLWLLLIGLVHAFLIWYGDILVFYALAGFALIPFARRQNRTLLIWAVILILLPLVLFAGITVLVELGRLSPDSRVELERIFAENDAANARLLELSTEAYAGSDVGAIVGQRAIDLGSIDLGSIYTYSILFLPNILALFLIGLNVRRRRVFQEIERHLPRIRRLFPVFLVVGIAGNAIMVAAAELAPHPSVPSMMLLVSQTASMLTAPALTCSYVFAIVLLSESPAWRRRFAPLVAVGRMALTNYIGQSLVCTTLFYGYGFGLYGKVSPAWGVLLTLVLFLLQIPFSIWWLGRWRFGPLEWIWRSLTYGKRQPMRKELEVTS
jgi:uncharacterized protein